jgi:transposase
MLIVPSRIKVFASLAPTDMRKGFPGLAGIVEKELGQSIDDGDLFLFFNRRRDRLKVLFFTSDGALILYKRLERGTFEPLRAPEGTSPAPRCLVLGVDDLRMLLEGIELSSIKQRARWRREAFKQKETKRIGATSAKAS